MRTVFVQQWAQPLTGWSLFWSRVAMVAGAIGWVALLLAVVVVPIMAGIYHALH